MVVICIKQHLSNIWSSIHEKVRQHCGWVEKKRSLKKKKRAANFRGIFQTLPNIYDGTYLQ